MTQENYQPGQRVRLLRAQIVYAPGIPSRRAPVGEVVTLARERGASAWLVRTDDCYGATVDAWDIAPEAQPDLFEVTP